MLHRIGRELFLCVQSHLRGAQNWKCTVPSGVANMVVSTRRHSLAGIGASVPCFEVGACSHTISIAALIAKPQARSTPMQQCRSR
mmetsp:Transcript_11685/g.24619  ORF Transcript_11685/g.24619 Transcript_11685/m.24619 type:complete len:85 (-) Transcript_11685:687-941(-)